MNGRTLLLSCLFVSLLSGGGIVWFFQTRQAEAAPKAADPAAIDRILSRLDAMEAGQNQTKAAIDDIRSAMKSAADAAASVAARRARAAEAGGSLASGEEAGDVPSAENAKKAAALTTAEALNLLNAPGIGDRDREEIWKRIREEKLLDGVVALLEQRAKADPRNPDAQTALAEVYLQKTQEAGNGPLAGEWAMKADGAYDAALAVDPEHFDARFGKAVSLSFWPPVLGKQGQAIKEFETLISKQAGRPTNPQSVHAYVFLGSLYQQTGKPEKALEVWRQGLTAFPDNASLQAQLAASK